MIKIGEITIDESGGFLWFSKEDGEGFSIHDQKECDHKHDTNYYEEFRRLIEDFYEKVM